MSGTEQTATRRPRDRGSTPGSRTGTKALIKVGYACNEHCSFCHTLEVRHIQGSTAEVDRKIRRAAELGHEMVVLSGGEPTIRPELVHWASLTASLDEGPAEITKVEVIPGVYAPQAVVTLKNKGRPGSMVMQMRMEWGDWYVAQVQTVGGL